jgi:hypothetical protein
MVINYAAFGHAHHERASTIRVMGRDAGLVAFVWASN